MHLERTVYGNWEEETARREVAAALAAATGFDVVFANNELMARGASRAVTAAGLHRPIVSTGGGPMGLTMIANGEVEATMSAPVSLQGMMTFRCLHEFVTSGTRSRKFIPLLTIPVDRSNIDTAVSWRADARNLAYVDGVR